MRFVILAEVRTDATIAHAMRRSIFFVNPQILLETRSLAALIEIVAPARARTQRARNYTPLANTL